MVATITSVPQAREMLVATLQQLNLLTAGEAAEIAFTGAFGKLNRWCKSLASRLYERREELGLALALAFLAAHKPRKNAATTGNQELAAAVRLYITWVARSHSSASR